MAEGKLTLREEFGLLESKPSPPKCCRECKYLDGETSDWDGQFYWYCERNVWFPTKKKTCKKQVLKHVDPDRRSASS